MKTQNALFRFAKRHLIPSLVLAGTLIDPAPVRAQTPALAATNHFGGAGDQRATAVSVAGGALYFSGVSAANSGDGLVGRYALPTVNNTAPVWSATWPALAGGDDFNGVAASADAVYVVGSSFGRTSDTVGGKENKGITVRFPLTGATGGGFGGSVWDRQTPAAPGAFGYGGGEGLWASLVTSEGGTNFIYVTGSGQVNGANGGRLFVSKLNTNGTVVWTRDDSASMVNNAYSVGRGLVALNGNIYVSGVNTDSGTKAYLRKYDSNGNLLWSRTTTSGSYIGVTTLGGSIFAVGQVGAGAAANFLVDKWDEAGNLSWSQQFDRNSAEDFLNGVAGLGARIYAVGATRGTTAGGADAAVLELDSVTGALISTTLYGGAQDDFANGIGTDGTDLYVGGESRSFIGGGNTAGQNDAFVLRYTVTPTLTSLTLSPTNPVIALGSNLQFIATGTFSDGTSRPLIASGNAWTNGAAIPSASYGLGGAFVGGKFYAISGFATARLGIYNPTNNTWITGAPLPPDTGFNLRQYAGVAVLDGKIYVAGGDTGGSGDRATLLRYDPGLNAWTNLAPMPLGARWGLGAAALNGKIYAVGGVSGSSTYLNRVEEYDPANNSWTTKASMPTAHFVALVGAIGGKLYVAGGSDASGPLTATHVYDPSLNAWTTNAPMPFTGHGNGVVLNGKLFSVGAGPSPEQRIFAYDPAANAWNTNFAPMPTGRHDLGVAGDEAGNRIFAVGGWNGSYVSALEIFTPPGEVIWNSASPAVASIGANGLATGASVGSSVITATAGILAANTTLTVVAPPAITNQPMNVTVAANGTTVLSVGASGGTLFYQWRLNGTNLAGANGPTLTLSALNASQAGVYDVVVSNVAGMVTSSSANLSLLSLNMYAGLTIVGQVGGNYQIDYLNDLNNTNWMNLTNVVLPSSPYLFIDTTSPQSQRRFYRAVLVP